jgi:methylenetetrahydrofolate dehydrogenase (NADP+)/methenyltetrahydrofolate cyclohydrolase
MTLVLDGKKARDFYKGELIVRVKALKAKGITPRLAIIQIGENAESSIYIGQKEKFAEAIGVRVDHIKLAAGVSQADVAMKVETLNSDPKVHGIIIQMPIPAGLDKLALMNLIYPKKDVDGLGDESQRLLDEGIPAFIPATAKGVMALLDFYKIDVSGKLAAVFGRSRLVGHPVAALLKIRGASVAVIHSQTPNPREVSAGADIVVAAIGKPRYVTADFVQDGAVVVDVGISSSGEVAERKIVGDVEYDAVSAKAAAISPVPGGVGPMTVLSLFDNLILSVERSIEK